MKLLIGLSGFGNVRFIIACERLTYFNVSLSFPPGEHCFSGLYSAALAL